MSFTSLKQIAIYSILLATLSQSVYIAEARDKLIGRLFEEEEPKNRLNRSYIKTHDGPQQSRPMSVDVVTTTTPNDETRKLQGEVRCRLWQNCMLFQDDQGNRHTWECSFDDLSTISRIGDYESKQVVVEGVPDTNRFLAANGAESGNSVLVLTEFEDQTDRIVAQYANGTGVRVEAFDPLGRVGGGDSGGGLRDVRPPKTGRRNLAPMSGDLNTLVVRVKANDNSPTGTASEISDDVFGTFGDEYNLKTQYQRCSYDKMRIQEYTGDEVSAPGVVELEIDMNAQGSTTEAVQSAANVALQEMFGVSNPGSIFDLVLFCMPPGMGGWLAYAYIGRWDSYYNDEWCQAMSSQMHEVGHSIGLHHSGEYTGSDANQEYGDQSDMMGFSYNSDDTPKMCFNPAKNWQLGWYEDNGGQFEINPNNLSNEPTSFYLNGVVDYGTMTDGAHVVLKILDFYIGYNKADGFNEEVREGADMVMVTEKLGSPTSSTLSKLVAKVSEGSMYTIVLSDILSVDLKFVRLEGDKDAVIELSVVGEIPQCQGEYDSSIVVDLVTDRYPTETSWAIADAAGHTIFSTSDGDYTSRNSAYSETIPNLCRGLQYYFIIYDGYGDGICCSWGNGSFEGKFGDLVLFNGGQFENQLTVPFMIPLPAPTPSESPSSTPTVKSSENPTVFHSREPSRSPSESPSSTPTVKSSENPTVFHSRSPSESPSSTPTVKSSENPTVLNSRSPSESPSSTPTVKSSENPTVLNSRSPSESPSSTPTVKSSENPTVFHSREPSRSPSESPSSTPTAKSSDSPTKAPTGGDCVDNTSYVYRNKPGKDCTWVDAFTDRQTRIVCLRRANADRSDPRKVYEYCKASCDAAGINKAC